jgi:hypothetical protein
LQRLTSEEAPPKKLRPLATSPTILVSRAATFVRACSLTAPLLREPPTASSVASTPGGGDYQRTTTPVPRRRAATREGRAAAGRRKDGVAPYFDGRHPPEVVLENTLVFDVLGERSA